MIVKLPRGLWIFLSMLLVMALGVTYFTYRDKEPPVISIGPEIAYTNGARPFEIQVHDPGLGLRSVEVLVMQHGQVKKSMQEEFDPGVGEWKANIELPRMDQGAFTIQVRAVDRSIVNWGKGNLSQASQEIIFDNVPPSISVATTVHNLNQGGAGLVIYAVSKEVEHTGVRLGDRFFPAQRQENGKYHCLFAFPFDAHPGSDVPRVEATDLAGNERLSGFTYHLNPRSFRQARLNISDTFLRSQMPQFESDFPEENDPFELFLRVNRDLRAQNWARVQRIAAKTSSALTLDRAMLRKPNSAQMAGFADHRTYYYQNREVDRQVHMGVDLASVAQAPVPAAADGRVVFVGDLGIYGQTVILDHGLGLQTLYAHLSSMAVEEGQSVPRGQSIGRTGTTGLAAGDHLHFEVVLSGVSVNPVEWWDPNWLENNIFSKLRGED